MPKFMWSLTQGTAQWYKARAGIPTSSQFHRIMTPKTGKPSEQRHRYAAELISERLLNWQANSLDKVEHIEAGRENEPFAVAQFEEIHEIETRPLGFVTTDDGRFGASPDRVGQVSADQSRVGIVLEAKAPTVPVQMMRLLFGDDESYRCQRMGHLWIAEADKAYFVSYNPRMPLYMVEQGRDEPFIAKLRDALECFSDELEEMTEKAKRLGAFQAFADLVTPAEAELGPALDDPDFVEKWVDLNAGRFAG